MDIISAKYTVNGAIEASIAGGRTMFIPDDMGNKDRRELAEWETAGNAITTYAAPDPRLSASLSKADFARALMAAGILSPSDALAVSKGEWPSAFDPYLVGMTDEQSALTQMAWIEAAKVSRAHPLIEELGKFARGAGMTGFAGLTDAQLEVALDTLFGIEQ